MKAEFEKAWPMFKSAGPVAIPGAQIKFYRAKVVVEPFLTQKQLERLYIAKSHARMEGRDEWDMVCKEIESKWGL